ncbi:MAG: hypothetical protein EOM25_01190 [Deltaproteobacteria bacterium]|nr:hypothetical protein [Deltaproteobacteria bacterium]
MTIEVLLAKNKKQIIARWSEMLFSTYASEGAKFFASKKDQFANPVGHTFHRNLESIFPLLAEAEGVDSDEIRMLIDGIVRIRAVQGFAPSRAVIFVSELKGAVKDVLGPAVLEPQNSQAWEYLCERIDRAQAMAFDIYMDCREKLWELKANHLYNRTHKLLERAQLIQDNRLG